MKIAFFTDSYYPMLNGVTVSVSNLAAELRALGHTVYIFAPKYGDYVDKEDNVYRLNAFKILTTEPEVHMPVLLPHKITQDINPRDFDIVHAHGNGFFSLLGYQIARVKGVPFIMTFHTHLARYTHYVFNGKIVTPKMIEAILRISGNISDMVITPSEKMKQELVSYGIKKPIEVVPNFVYTEKFSVTKKDFLHNLCKIEKNSPILLSVGRLGHEKNFPFLLRSFKKISEQNKDVHLVIVGTGEEAESIEDYAKSLSLGDRVHFPGRVDQKDIPNVYADSDLFVFASQTETQGIVMLEAGSAGLPFVVVKDKAYDNIIISGQNGYQVTAKPGVFAEKVLELLSDTMKRKSFGERSKQIIRENFDPKGLTANMIHMYQDVIDRKKQRRLNFVTLNRAAWRRVYRATEILDKIFE